VNLNRKYLVFGFVRTGTHRIKELINKNFNKNYKFSEKVFHSQKSIVWYFKGKYYIFNSRKKNNLKFSSIKNLKKEKILSFHNFEKRIINNFKDYNLIITIRDPLLSIASLISYNTKKNVVNFNPKFKIFSAMELATNKIIIKNYMKQYNNFYSKVLKSNLNKFTVIDFSNSIKLISKKLKLKPYKINRPKFHSSNKHPKLIVFLRKNYDFKKSYNIYNSIKNKIK